MINVSLVSVMTIIWKSFFDFDMKLCNSSKGNDNESMFEWNKGKGLPVSLGIRIQVLDGKVCSNIVFRINSFDEVFSIRDCWFCYMSKFDLFSDECLYSLLLKTEYGRNVLGQSIQYQWEQACIFHSILVGIPSSLVGLLSVGNRGDGGCFT